MRSEHAQKLGSRRRNARANWSNRQTSDVDALFLDEFALLLFVNFESRRCRTNVRLSVACFRFDAKQSVSRAVQQRQSMLFV